MLETGKITVEVRSLNGKTADIGIKTSMLSGHRRERSWSIRHRWSSMRRSSSCQNILIKALILNEFCIFADRKG